MPRRRKVKPFLLMLVDHDKKIFNIIGPVTSDTDWTFKIVELQETGRNVSCHVCRSTVSIDDIARSYSEQTGYRFSLTLIADEPIDRSSEYKGPLPKYAESADRKKLVRILCDGRCGTTRWAEMHVNYPGQRILRNSDLGDFTATCLKCGYTANDPYNWFR